MASGAITFSKLSGSGADGDLIKVTGNGSGSAVTVHTASAADTDFVDVTVYNSDTSPRDVYVQKGASDWVPQTVGAKRALKLLTRSPLTSSGTIKVYGSVVDVLYVDGHARRVEA